MNFDTIFPALSLSAYEQQRLLGLDHSSSTAGNSVNVANPGQHDLCPVVGQEFVKKDSIDIKKSRPQKQIVPKLLCFGFGITAGVLVFKHLKK